MSGALDVPRACAAAAARGWREQRDAPPRRRIADGPCARRIDREDLLLRRLDDPAPDAFEALLARRLAHEPVAYITGRRAFWTIELEVGPGVLVPRPDSETLIEAAIAYFGERGAGAHPRSRHRPGHLAARRARPVAGGDRARRRRFGRGAGLCPPQRRCPARNSGSAIGRRGSTSASTSSCATRLMSKHGAALPPDVARCEPAAALYRRRRRARRLSRPRAATGVAAGAGRRGLRGDRRGTVDFRNSAVRRAGLHDRVTKRP